jgi:hypothetical protein
MNTARIKFGLLNKIILIGNRVVADHWQRDSAHRVACAGRSRNKLDSVHFITSTYLSVCLSIYLSISIYQIASLYLWLYSPF